jgi:hypothetical protein
MPTRDQRLAEQHRRLQQQGFLTNSVFSVIKKTPPADSWWTKQGSRDAFMAAAKREAPRMAQ